MKKIFPYLLLNILISALTMWIVLLVWQKAHPAAVYSTPVIETGEAPQPSPQETSQVQSYEDQQLEISRVVGAGDLDLEVLTLQNTGKTAVSLAGWTISDTGGFTYTFPSLTVYSGGAFQLFSRSGVNTAIELYAGSASALWKSGSVILLKDPSGKQRQQFNIP